MVSFVDHTADPLSMSSTHTRESPKKDDEENRIAVTYSLRDALLREQARQTLPQQRATVTRRNAAPSEFKLKLLEACYLQGSVALWDPEAVDFDYKPRKATKQLSHSDGHESRPRRCCF